MIGTHRRRPLLWLLPVLSVAFAWGACSVYQAIRSARLDALAWVDYQSDGENIALNWRTLEVTEPCGCVAGRLSRTEARKLDADSKPLDPKERARILTAVGEAAFLHIPRKPAVRTAGFQ